MTLNAIAINSLLTKEYGAFSNISVFGVHNENGSLSRPYWEYFGKGVANCTPGAYKACDGVQSRITTNFIRACLLEFSLIHKL